MKDIFTVMPYMMFILSRQVSSFVPTLVRRTLSTIPVHYKNCNSNILSSSTSTLHFFSTTCHKPILRASPVVTALADNVDTATKEEESALPTNENDDQLLRIRHTSAHVMAMAVQQTFPEAQVTIGPWIDNGFYYDFYFPETRNAETGEMIPARKLSDDDLKEIKKSMDKIISASYPIQREEVSREEARRRIELIQEPFKLEILNSIKTEPITIYHIGDQWWDLCAGPHVENTKELPKKGIELQSVAGAYWRGDEKREMLQRIYATAWKTPDQLKQYKKMVEEAKKRDHRMLGKKLDLFSIQVC